MKESALRQGAGHAAAASANVHSAPHANAGLPMSAGIHPLPIENKTGSHARGGVQQHEFERCSFILSIFIPSGQNHAPHV